MSSSSWAQQHYAHLVEVRGHIRTTIGAFEQHPDVEDWPRRVPKQLSTMLEQYLARLRDHGRTRSDWQPRAAASMLLGTLFADAISRDLIPDHLPSPAEDAPRQYVELFLNAIGYEVSRS